MAKVFKICLSFIIVIFLSANKLNAQTTTYIDWKCELKGHWGSFWWKVDKSEISNNGYYYFYVYFSSNSYLNNVNPSTGNYFKAITYISNLNITMSSYRGDYPPYNITIPYQLVDWESKKIAYFYSSDPTPMFIINYGAVNPYNYSLLIK